MERTSDRLAKQAALLQSGDISPSTVVHFRSLARQAMEEQSLKNQFPVAAMYCDWSLHTKLDRKQARDLLDQIDAHINAGYLHQAAAAQARAEGRAVPAEAAAQSNEDPFAILIRGAMAPKLCIEQLARLLMQIGVAPSVFYSPTQALQFGTHLLTELAGKPLERQAADVGKLEGSYEQKGWPLMSHSVIVATGEGSQKFVLEVNFVARQGAGKFNMKIQMGLL